MTGFSDNNSEKPKRGRPSLQSIDRKAWDYAGQALPSGTKSHRSHMNQFHLNAALAALSLKDDENRRVYGWLVRIAGDEPDWRSRVSLRRVILIELGRIENRNSLLEAARLICETKPTTTEAVAIIRRYRPGKSSKGTAEGLKGELIRHLNDYLKRYPEISLEDVRVAVSSLLAAVEQIANKPSPGPAHTNTTVVAKPAV